MINSLLCPKASGARCSLALTSNLDFSRGTGPLTHTRASTTLTVDSSGYYQQLAIDAPAFDSAGLRVTPVLKNKCECYGLLPSGYAFGTTATPASPNGISSALTVGGAAAFVATVFDDSANIDGGTRKISAIQPDGKILKLDNSGGATGGTVTISGTTTNLNAHSYGITHRGGTGSLALGANTTTLATAANYTKTAGNNKTPGATTDKLIINVDAGQTVYVTLPGLYESTTVPKYPIASVGTVGGTTRAQTTASLPLAPNFRQDSFMVTCEWTPDFSLADLPNSTAVPICTLEAGVAFGPLYFFRDVGGVGTIKTYDGVNVATIACSPVAGTTYKIGVRGTTAGNNLQTSLNGVNGTAASYDGAMPVDGQNKIYLQGLIGGASTKNLRITTDRGAAALAVATT